MTKAHWLMSVGAILALGCKKDNDDKTRMLEGSFNGLTYYVVDPGNLERSETLIKGSGAIVFAAPLNAISSQANFGINFTLGNAGSLSLVSHANNSLQQGIVIQLDRTGTSLLATLRADGSGTSEKVLNDQDASAPLSLAVDVHNNESPAHVLIWDAIKTSFNENDAIYNSETDEQVPGVGKATLWGLVLLNAEVSSASLNDAKLSEK